MATAAEWMTITARLREPIPVEHIKWRFAKVGRVSQGQKGEVLAYVTSRGIQDRLDEVVPGAWQFTWDAIVTNEKGIMVAKGRIQIYDLVREDVGDASNLEPNKGAISDAMKRAAVQWGIGRYLYSLPYVEVTAGPGGSLPPPEIAKLRQTLQRFTNTPAVAATSESTPVKQDEQQEQQEPTRIDVVDEIRKLVTALDLPPNKWSAMKREYKGKNDELLAKLQELSDAKADGFPLDRPTRKAAQG